MEIVVRAACAYLFLLLLLRALGRRELSQLTAFDLLIMVVLGDLVQQGVTQEDMSLTGAFVAVGTFGLLSVAGSFAAHRWSATRNLLDGAAIVVIRDGHVFDEALRRERITIDDLMEAARHDGVSDLAAVELAVLETDGSISFLR